MKIYMVGGAVRDGIANRPADDQDYVVVGATPEEMIEAGFTQVGKDFPVFINRMRPGEFTLARRWEQDGTFSFPPDVTLEEDLSNRDISINTMAVDPDTGEIVDVFDGESDMDMKVLRAINNNVFVQDPLRILRIARFAARWPDFIVHRDTMTLMRHCVDSGGLDVITPERVWKELSRGLLAKKPSRMLQVLRKCGALKVIIPELDVLWGVPQPMTHHPEIDTGIHMEMVVDYAANQGYPIEVCWAALMHDLGKGVTPKDEWPAHHGHEGMGMRLVENVCARLRVPTTCRKVAMMTTREHGNVSGALSVRVATMVKMFAHCDAFRNPANFELMLRACECDYFGRGDFGQGQSMKSAKLRPYPQPDRLRNALIAASAVEKGPIAERMNGRVEFIKDAIHAARVSAVKRFEHRLKAVA
jgi:tRNA nucleotidyltransferase (CCA-adding enzyme)